MSEITAGLAREVLEIALTYLPERLEDLLRARGDLLEAETDMSRGQSSGPYAQPAAVEVARERLESELENAALDVEDYAAELHAKAAMA